MKIGRNIARRILERILPEEIAYAHCDIPCGIYDPHYAQMAAHTVIRMDTLIGEGTEKAKGSSSPTEMEQQVHAMARYTEIKERHAEICKHEVRILWGDYFKPDHAEAFPDLHDLVWKVMMLGSQSKQTTDLQVGEELLDTVNRIAEIFWKTKDVTTVRTGSHYPTGREMVVPTAG
ncbi:MAG: superoxide dismutase, Ni [Thermoplasmata archaeon]